MIVSGYSEMKAYLPTLAMKTSTTDIFTDALNCAQDALVSEIIGSTLEATLETRQTADSALFKHCQRVISRQAFLALIPELDLILTDAGFGVVSNEKTVMASTDRVKALKTRMSEGVDEAKDALISYLMRTAAYDSWRSTEEFAKLSDALFMTFAEFKDAAVLNNMTAKSYPKCWSDFFALNSALNVALMTDVACYISKDYAEEILEKIRDKETFLPNEKKALKLIKTAVAAYALTDNMTGQDQAVKAIALMRSHLTDFPTYAASPEAQELKVEHDNKPIFAMI